MKPSLSIVIPCFNEGESINSLIEKCKKSLDNRSDIEIVLVNNGSTDSTSEIFKEINQNKKIFPYIIIKNIKKNLGYGNGIIEGLNKAEGNILSWTHADLQTDPKDVILAYDKYRKSLELSSCIVKGKRIGRNFFDNIFTAGMSLISSILLKTQLWDINAQPKIFNRSFLKFLKNAPKDFSLDLFVLYVAKKQKIQINTYPVKFSKRKFGISKGGGSLKGKIKLIHRTFKYIKELRNAILNEK